MEKEELDGERIFLIHNLLTPQECEQHIARTEALGYGDAPITTSVGFVMRKDIRNNERVIVDDVGLAHSLFERARPLLPAEWYGWQLVGLNERFRFYRYDPGQYFAPHTDGYFQRGLTYVGLNKIPEAKADFKKVLELSPTGPQAETAKKVLEGYK